MRVILHFMVETVDSSMCLLVLLLCLLFRSCIVITGARQCCFWRGLRGVQGETVLSKFVVGIAVSGGNVSAISVKCS